MAAGFKDSGGKLSAATFKMMEEPKKTEHPIALYVILSLIPLAMLGQCVKGVIEAQKPAPKLEIIGDDAGPLDAPQSDQTAGKIQEFNTWMQGIDPDQKLLVSAQYPRHLDPGSGKGIVEVTVSDSWHLAHKQLRLQTVQNLQKAWAKLYGSQKNDSAHIWLVDLNGNRVGGTDWPGTISVND